MQNTEKWENFILKDRRAAWRHCNIIIMFTILLLSTIIIIIILAHEALLAIYLQIDQLTMWLSSYNDNIISDV